MWVDEVLYVELQTDRWLGDDYLGDFERLLVPAAQLLREGTKEGYEYPRPEEVWTCDQDGCDDTATGTDHELEAAGWTHYGFGGGTWCPEHRNST